jgi:hypothetical protein
MAIKKKTGGRKKGTPNNGTAELKALAQDYTEAAIVVMAAIMKNPDATDAARVSAANALLDRAHGKVPQGIGLGGGSGEPLLPRRVIIELADVD